MTAAMSFALSKVFWTLAEPGDFLVLLLSLGVLLGWTRYWRRTGRRLVVLATLALLFIALSPVDMWLTLPLEDRFPAVTNPPAHVDGIIVLGGALRPNITKARGQPALTEAAERMTAFAGLVRRYPDAKLLFTGGNAALFPEPGQLTEADVARALFADLGLPVARIVFEDKSRNTYDNAVMSKAIMEPKPGETWLLVTSAFHMPRAVGCFRQSGWPVLPWPVDYQFAGNTESGWGFGFTRRLQRFGDALHEWLGLLAYRTMGRINAVFPGP